MKSSAQGYSRKKNAEISKKFRTTKFVDFWLSCMPRAHLYQSAAEDFRMPALLPATSLFTAAAIPPRARKTQQPLKWTSDTVLPEAVIGKRFSVNLPPLPVGDSHRVTYTVQHAPRWLSFDHDTLTVSGTPPSPGNYAIKISAACDIGSAKTTFTVAVCDPTARFGHVDTASGKWIGRQQELGTDDVHVNSDTAHRRVSVPRILDGLLTLYQANKITDEEFHAGEKWYRNWSVGTGHPMMASETRFLGVSSGGARESDGIATRQLTAATAHREACLAVGVRAAERLTEFICYGRSLRAAAMVVGVNKLDIAGLLVSDIQRLAEHYAVTARARAAEAKAKADFEKARQTTPRS